MIRYELHTEGKVIIDGPDELKGFAENIESEWAIYKYCMSSMGEVKVSAYRTLTIADCRMIAKQYASGKSPYNLEREYKIARSTIFKIINDQFGVLKSKY